MPSSICAGLTLGEADDVRRPRVLLRAVKQANERIAEDEDATCEPLPEGLSPHGPRRSFASWLVAEGEDPAYVMQQMGHTDPTMTLGLYAKALRSKGRRADRTPDRGLTGTRRESPIPEALDGIAL